MCITAAVGVSTRQTRNCPQQYVEPDLLPDEVLPISQSEHQQPGFGPRALPEQLTMHQGMDHSAQQLFSQDAQAGLPAACPSA